MRSIGSRTVDMVLVALVGAAAASCGKPSPPRASIAIGSAADLAAHSAIFEREIIEVVPGIHVAVGYGLANSILLEGEDGVVIVDTMESAEAARPVKAAFQRISSKPVKAIIYTHNHADHIFGARVLAGNDHPDVYSYVTTPYYIDRAVNLIYPIIYKRSMRQFGVLLPAGGVINAGIGPRLAYDANATPALLRPTKTFTGHSKELRIAGIRMQLVHAPGETPDQIFVWLPERRVLLCGDNFYESFPNLYAIRGTPYRDVMDWVHSLDEMRALRPAFLVPSHTRPISGEKQIFQALTDYRDAIQFVHDQTVRAMNAGLGPDEIVERVKLPARLASKPYLHEYYGRVDWAVRSIFAGYLGWFGGDAAELAPLGAREHGKRLAGLLGGQEGLVKQSRQALDAGDVQWAVELASDAVAAFPGNDAARGIRGKALRRLAATQSSANARSYYLTQALETEKALEITPQDPAKIPEDMLASFPIANFMAALAINLDSDKSAQKNLVVGFRFLDTGEVFTIHVRYGVAELQPRFPKAPDLTVTTDTIVWKKIITRRRSVPLALADGSLKIEGSVLEFGRFLLLFRPSV